MEYQSATGTGFSRGVERGPGETPKGQNPRTERQNGDSPVEGQSRRFAVAYHLLSVATNRRLRLRAYCEAGEPPMLDSVIEVWKAADWYEREAFDLYGICLPRAPGPAPDTDRLRLHRASVPQGLPADRQRRGAVRRRQGARGLRAGLDRAANAGAEGNPRGQPVGTGAQGHAHPWLRSRAIR